MLKCSLDKLSELFGALSEKAALYLPVDGEGGAKYQKWSEGSADEPRSQYSAQPKGFFFPQTENLMGFKLSGKEIELIDTPRNPRILLYLACVPVMCAALMFWTACFLQDTPDSYYASRREHGIIISWRAQGRLRPAFVAHSA